MLTSRIVSSKKNVIDFVLSRNNDILRSNSSSVSTRLHSTTKAKAPSVLPSAIPLTSTKLTEKDDLHYNMNNHMRAKKCFKSTQRASDYDDEEESTLNSKPAKDNSNVDSRESISEYINFPSSSLMEPEDFMTYNAEKTTPVPEKPVLLNSKQHVVGYLSKILNARVYQAAIETDLMEAKNMSNTLRNNIYFKREDTQPVFSFKIRGAYNKMAHLTKKELEKGVVACSAGNHAQGVALSANMLKCKAVIVMPLATPMIKVNSVRVHGGQYAEIRLFGNNYDEAAGEAKRLQKEEGMTMIHPFDDPYVIAGQGTIGMEILKSCVSKPLDAIFVCCGGGGMLAGIAAYVKRVRPNVKVIGVEAADAAGMTESLKHGEVVTLDHVGLFADGAAGEILVLWK